VPRPIWTGSISFGLVNVPVKLLTAVRKKDVRFHQLHAADGARIQQRRVCTAEGTEVAFEDLAKGYEVSPGRYVMIEPEELESLDPEATHTIDIEAFVPLSEIDPLYFDSSYYLIPDARGDKPYRLLLDAMATTDRVGIARFVLRNKQYLCALRPVGDALVLSTMNFADEVVGQDEVGELPRAEVEANERELSMARQLIDALASEFDPDAYHDTYREKVLELIEAKAQGEEIVEAAPVERPAPVVDLITALEASLADAGKKPKRAPGDGEAAAS
jgi:DNA end-binding protein Ku